MSFGGSLDASMDSMEETRFKKKHQSLIQSLEKKLHFSYQEIECLLIIYYKLQKDGPENNGSKQPGVTKVQFRDVLHCALDMTDDSLMDRLFLALDKGPSSYISMETWVTALSLFLRGTLNERINFCFAVYDVMGDGVLAKDSMFYLLRTSMVSPSSDEDAEEAARVRRARGGWPSLRYGSFCLTPTFAVSAPYFKFAIRTRCSHVSVIQLRGVTKESLASVKVCATVDMIEVITKKMDLDRDGKISFNDYKQSVLKHPQLLEVFGQCFPSRLAAQTFLTTFTKTEDTL